jgi:hypothetical protein
MDIPVGRQSHWPISRIPITFREECSKLLRSLSPIIHCRLGAGIVAGSITDDPVLWYRSTSFEPDNAATEEGVIAVSQSSGQRRRTVGLWRSPDASARSARGRPGGAAESRVLPLLAVGRAALLPAGMPASLTGGGAGR